MNIPELYTCFLQSTGVSTDTRSLSKGNLFFALKGENFDANAFAAQALEKGAIAVVVDNPDIIPGPDSRFILTENTLTALQELASYHIGQTGTKVIAITGSNGKTTTKELLSRVLSEKYTVHFTRGNLNNHIGVPLTILSMPDHTEIAVIEMGASHFGEITRLCEIARPDYGYITNFGKAHLEGFGSEQGVIKAKTELYQYLHKHDNTAFINSGKIQTALTAHMKHYDITKGISMVSSIPFVTLQCGQTLIESKLTGKYNYENIRAAIGIGLYFEVEIEQIKKAVESYIPQNKRSQIIRKGNVEIILDAYNANPTSMIAALENFAEYPAGDKAVILGDMLELGSASLEEHEKIARRATEHFDTVILIGKEFAKTGIITRKYDDFESFKQDFNEKKWEGKTLLIKASRGIALERIVELFGD